MTKYNEELIKLPFDQFSRQSRAEQLIDTLRKKNEFFTILDVGGYKGVTKQFHPKDKVTILDVFDIKDEGYVQGDATKMKFKDNSYDFVVSFDVFEHIPREKREQFVSECSRVAKRGVIIAAPIGTAENAYAEESVNRLYKEIYGKDHEWLIEHIDYKLPESGLAKSLLESNKLYTFNFSSNYTPIWALMQSTIFAASKFETVGDRINELYKAYNSQLPSDGVPETDENYRSIILGLRSEKDKAEINKKINSIFISKKKYFENLVTLTLKASETLVLGINDLYNASNIERDELTTMINQLNATNAVLTKKFDEINTKYNLIVNSRSYRYARKAAKVINKPKNVMRKQ